MDPQDIAENDAERARLRSLVAGMSEAELARRLDGDWTVGAALAHLAFWDRRGRLLLEAWERGDVPRPDPDWYSQVLNDALLPLWLALPPADAARMALEAAEAVDVKVSALDERLVDEITGRGEEWRLRRFRHRREHLDEIERALQPSEP